MEVDSVLPASPAAPSSTLTRSLPDAAWPVAFTTELATGAGSYPQPGEPSGTG